jgi:hypothetical protein
LVARRREPAAVVQITGTEEAPARHVPIGDEPALGGRRRDDAAPRIGRDRASALWVGPGAGTS